MSGVLIWYHADFLNPLHPAHEQYPAAPAVFVFDEELLEQYRISLKRIAFIYECLLEIPNLEIRKGDVVAELVLATQEHQAELIVTVDSVAPRFAKLVTKLRREHKLVVEVVTLPPFVDLDQQEEERLDLKRFSRYWQAVSSRATRRK